VSLTSLSPVIAKIQSQPNWQERRRFLQIISHWQEVVGVSVALQTRPTGIYRQVLQVAVSSSAWSQALAFERLRILAKLQALQPSNAKAITDIHFSTAKWHSLSVATSEIISNSISKATLEQSPPSELLTQHPSYVAPKPLQTIQLPLPPSSALEAFQRLAAIVKTQTATMPKCPRCRCAAPLGELKRWEMCSTCVRRDF
jgi:predicted nucleic acid-binding Zn ribbon protein